LFRAYYLSIDIAVGIDTGLLVNEHACPFLQMPQTLIEHQGQEGADETTGTSAQA